MICTYCTGKANTLPDMADVGWHGYRHGIFVHYWRSGSVIPDISVLNRYIASYTVIILASVSMLSYVFIL